ncbi:MAG: hypothetical protein QOI66_3023 [Myxococcales bacterium]|jgi:hypothetical protein|nr:hypothetical protein [Myxococcales bacterium]
MTSKVTGLAMVLGSAAFIIVAADASQAAPIVGSAGETPSSAVVAPFQTIPIPGAIAAQAGASLKFRAHARGVQVYTCTASTAGATGGSAGAPKYAWVLKAPDARLYDENNTPIGMHFGGPTWLSTDGSGAVGSKIGQVNSPLSDAIPWLQLKIVKHTGSGVFTDIAYVQRLNTTKGVAPGTGCDVNTIGTTRSVDYTADYYFYKGVSVTSEGT